jgi:hypothetical protein
LAAWEKVAKVELQAEEKETGNQRKVRDRGKEREKERDRERERGNRS